MPSSTSSWAHERHKVSSFTATILSGNIYQVSHFRDELTLGLGNIKYLQVAWRGNLSRKSNDCISTSHVDTALLYMLIFSYVNKYPCRYPNEASSTFNKFKHFSYEYNRKPFAARAWKYYTNTLWHKLYIPNSKFLREQ